MSFPRYPTYKPSGVEWLGEVPEHWRVCRFSRYINSIKDGTHGTFQRVGEGEPLLSAKNVLLGKIRIDDCESLISIVDHLSITSNGFPRKGDILLTIVGTIGRSCVYRLEAPLAFQRSVCFIRLEKPLSREYFDYQIQSKFFQEQLLSRTKIAAQGGVYMGDVMATSVCCPSPQDQLAIAGFLDHETAKIDALIAEQQRLIELLQEKRQAVISHAVTKGLNPDAPMKDSGVEWLGEVPEHWEVLELKHLKKEGTSITYGIVQAGPHIEDGIPYIRTSDMASDRLMLATCQRTSLEIDESYARSRVVEGDLVVAIRATVGKVLEVPVELDGANLTQGTAKFSPGPRVYAKFVKSSFEADYCQSQIMSSAKGATFLEITLDVLRRIKLAIPPLTEQKEIVLYLAEATAQLGDLLGAAELTIFLLQERRSALISAAVTGKIDVRGLAPEDETA